jgi:diguanylate cyclase (GGDEF)-like protein
MRGAGSITFLSGSLLVAVAWLAGGVGVSDPYRTVAAVLAEPLALVLCALAWRFRRSRLALAAAVIAVANLLVRGPLEPGLSGVPSVGLAALSLLLPANLVAVAATRDRGVPHPRTLVHLALVLCQPWLAAGVIHVSARLGVATVVPTRWLQLLRSSEVALLVFLIAAVFTALIFAARRGTFEVALLWALVAAALAVLGGRGAGPAALMLASAQLVLLFALAEDSYRLAYHDPLTGLPGRRALDEALRSLGSEYSVAMVDIDHFKRFNDRFGHDVGDQALRMVADELARVGGGGRAYRYGGEEFALLFPGRRAADVREVLEDLRSSIGNRSFTIRSPERPRDKPERPVKPKGKPREVALTVSIGAAERDHRHRRPDDVLRTADTALYRAKRRGRNRLVVEGLRAPPRRP